MPYTYLDGCRVYTMDDDEPITRDPERLAAVTRAYYARAHATWLCSECAPSPSAAPAAAGVCESCGRERYVVRYVRSPKPRQEARAS